MGAVVGGVDGVLGIELEDLLGEGLVVVLDGVLGGKLGAVESGMHGEGMGDPPGLMKVGYGCK